jgi:hypothetical protein
MLTGLGARRHVIELVCVAVIRSVADASCWGAIWIRFWIL